jgi:hypothetical protein
MQGHFQSKSEAIKVQVGVLVQERKEFVDQFSDFNNAYGNFSALLLDASSTNDDSIMEIALLKKKALIVSSYTSPKLAATLFNLIETIEKRYKATDPEQKKFLKEKLISLSTEVYQLFYEERDAYDMRIANTLKYQN